jgi:hypothetical protein
MNSYTLGGIGVFGWIIWSVLMLWGTLLFWQIGLALFTFGVCIFLYQKFNKKDAAVAELRMEKRQLHLHMKELSKSYDFLKKETTENLEIIVDVSNHRNTILSALKEANTHIIILSGWLKDWAFNEEF